MNQKSLSKTLCGLVVLCLVLGVPLCVELTRLGIFLADENPQYAYLLVPGLTLVYLSAAGVYAVLILAWKMFVDIGRDQSFTVRNSLRLKQIAILFTVNFILYVIGLVVLFIVNALQPGIILGMLFVIFVGISLAVICSCLSHLIYKAALMKHDVDLTI